MMACMAANPSAAAELASTAHFAALNVLRGRAHHHRGFKDGHNGYTADTASSAKRSNQISVPLQADQRMRLPNGLESRIDAMISTTA